MHAGTATREPINAVKIIFYSKCTRVHANTLQYTCKWYIVLTCSRACALPTSIVSAAHHTSAASHAHWWLPCYAPFESHPPYPHSTGHMSVPTWMHRVARVRNLRCGRRHVFRTCEWHRTAGWKGTYYGKMHGAYLQVKSLSEMSREAGRKTYYIRTHISGSRWWHDLRHDLPIALMILMWEWCHWCDENLTGLQLWEKGGRRRHHWGKDWGKLGGGVVVGGNKVWCQRLQIPHVGTL